MSIINTFLKITKFCTKYRVPQKVVYKLNMLVSHIMMNKIYIGTCVRKLKLRPLEGGNCPKMGEWEK